MTLKDDMRDITSKANKTQFEKEQEEIRQKSAEDRKEGVKRAEEIIKKLPEKIKKAAEKGKNRVYESTDSHWGPGGYMLSCIENWADKNGFGTRFKWRNEPANEGGDEYDSLVISW